MSGPRRRVLIVAPAFPPHPSPAAHRPRFLARYAAAFGWEAKVISVRPRFYAEAPDPELEYLLAKDLDVRRVAALPYRVARRVGFGDLSLRALPFLLQAVREECRRRRPDMIFVSAPPFFTFLTARAAKREFGVPYVLDYTDPWIFPLSPGQRSPTSRAYWMDRVARLLEPGIVRDAAHVLAVSDATHAGVRTRQPGIPAERFSAMPIGFDPCDFAALRENPRPNQVWGFTEGAIHVLHPGAIAPTGGETVRALLRAVKLLKEENPAIGSRLRLHFLGTSYAPDQAAPIVTPMAREVGVSELVSECTVRVPYLDALNAILNADVVLTLGSAEPHYTASKVYNCIASGRPVLAICHEDTQSVRAAVENTGAGRVVTYDDDAGAEMKISEIAAALAAMIASGPTGATPTSLQAIDAFSARSMTGNLVSIFERVAEPAVAAEGAR